ncbi:MAG: tetratricopeptide repeat protein [Nitrospinaceae bacterium]
MNAHSFSPKTSLIRAGVLLMMAGMLWAGCESTGERGGKKDREYFEAVQNDPGDAEARFNLGLTYEALGNIEDARKEFQKTLELNPLHERAHFSLAALNFRARDYEAALEEYRRVTRIDPASAEAHSNIGALYHLTGRHPKEIAEYEEAVRLKPDFANAHFNLSVAYDEADQGKSAVRHMKIAEQLLQEIKRGEENRGMLRLARENLQAYAKKYNLPPANLEGNISSPGAFTVSAKIFSFKKVIEKNPGNIMARFKLGSIYYHQGRYEEAIREFQEVTRLYKNAVTAYNNLAGIYIEMNRYQDAIHSLNQALEINPGFTVVLINLGKTYQLAGRWQEAGNALEKALRIQPANTDLLFGLASLNFKRERFQDSVDVLNRILRLEPGHADAHFAMSLAYDKLGQGEQAIEHAKIAEKYFTDRHNSFMMDQCKKTLALFYKRYGSLSWRASRIP